MLMNHCHEIFICHSGEIKNEAGFPLMAMFSYFCGEDFSFFDQASLSQGKRAQPEILQAVSSSRLLLVILSKSFFKSNYTLDELETFLNRNKESFGSELLNTTIVPIFYEISPDTCNDLPDELCLQEASSIDSRSIAEKRKLAKQLIEFTGREISFQYKNDTDGYFWVDVAFGVLKNNFLFKNSPLLKRFQTLSDTGFRERLWSIYQAARLFHSLEDKPTAEIFKSFLSDLEKGKRSQFIALNPTLRNKIELSTSSESEKTADAIQGSIMQNRLTILEDKEKSGQQLTAEEGKERTYLERKITEIANKNIKHTTPLASAVVSFSKSAVSLYLQRLKNCIEQEDDEIFIKIWEQLIQEGSKFCSFEDIRLIAEFLDPLSFALVDLNFSYAAAMQLYEPWLKHSAMQIVDKRYWVEALAVTAQRYYEAEKYDVSKLLYQDALALYQQEGMPFQEILLALMKTSFLMGDLAEATLYMLYIQQFQFTADELQKFKDTAWLDILEKSVFIHLVEEQSWCNRSFGQLVRCEQDKSRYILPFLKALQDTTHHLWLLKDSIPDKWVQNRLLQKASDGYSYVLKLVNQEKISLTHIPLSHSAFVYRGVTSFPDAAIPNKLHKQFEPLPCVWKGVKKILQTARNTIAKRLNSAVTEFDQLSPPSSVQAIMTEAMVSTVHYLLEEGKRIWGEPPCKFAILSMGSLARAETCPFSDLEFTILLEEGSLEYQKIEATRYFKTWVQWVEWQIVALGESERMVTWLPSSGAGLLTIPLKPGFRFDEGGNVPFSGKGSECFLGTADDLLKNFNFVFSGEEVSGDMIAANTLQNAAFLAGDQQCFIEFQEKLGLRLKDFYSFHAEQGTAVFFHQEWALHLLRSHIRDQKFNIVIDTSCPVLNLKEGLLRFPTFFIETLALHQGIMEVSTERRLECLLEKGVIGTAMASALMICIQAGLWWRHKMHIYYGYEEEKIYFSQEASKNSDHNKFLISSPSPYVLSLEEKQQFYMLYHLFLSPTRQLIEHHLPQLVSGMLLKVQPSPWKNIIAYRTAYHHFPELTQTLTHYIEQLKSQKRHLELAHCQHFLTVLQSASNLSPSLTGTSQNQQFWRHRPPTTSTELLLKAVVSGNLRAIQEHLKKYPQDLSTAGDIIDLSQRHFPKITAFQYALWACDKSLCMLLLKYLPEREAIQQWQFFSTERTDIHQKYGIHFNLQPLLNYYLQYIDLCNRRQYAESAEIWCKQISVEQARLPVWLVHFFAEDISSAQGKTAMLWFEKDVQKRSKMMIERANCLQLENFYKKSLAGNGAWVRGAWGAILWAPRGEVDNMSGNQSPLVRHDKLIFSELWRDAQKYQKELTVKLQATALTEESPSSCCVA